MCFKLFCLQGGEFLICHHNIKYNDFLALQRGNPTLYGAAGLQGGALYSAEQATHISQGLIQSQNKNKDFLGRTSCVLRTGHVFDQITNYIS